MNNGRAAAAMHSTTQVINISNFFLVGSLLLDLKSKEVGENRPYMNQ
jgi:hypothetical protein